VHLSLVPYTFEVNLWLRRLSLSKIRTESQAGQKSASRKCVFAQHQPGLVVSFKRRSVYQQLRHHRKGALWSVRFEKGIRSR